MELMSEKAGSVTSIVSRAVKPVLCHRMMYFYLSFSHASTAMMSEHAIMYTSAAIFYAIMSIQE